MPKNRVGAKRYCSPVSNFRSGLYEGFWSYAKHILYQYRRVSKYHFPMYLKEIEYRFNHRQENVFKQFLKIYFGYVSPQLPNVIIQDNITSYLV